MRTTWHLRDHYDLLEIPRDATAEEIKKAKQIQLAVWHQGPLQNSEHAKERVQAILEAADVLSQAAKKKKYDRTLMPEVSEEVAFTDRLQRRPEVWKRMAAWMKDENVGTQFLRKMAFSAGDYIERRRQPSEKQLKWMREAWSTAFEQGFDPEAEE